MKTPIWLALLVIIGIASFKLGIEIGIYQFVIYDSPYKAFMASTQLEKLETQKFSHIKTIQELRLTDEIINYGKYLKYGMPWMLWPRNTEHSEEILPNSLSRGEFMKKVINYRKSHPIENPNDPFYDSVMQEDKLRGESMEGGK